MSEKEYKALVSDASLGDWFPQGVTAQTTMHEHSYDSELVKNRIMPLLPRGVTQVKAIALCVGIEQHNKKATIKLSEDMKDEHERVELWTPHPRGWLLQTSKAQSNRRMSMMLEPDAARPKEPWAFVPSQGVEWIYQGSNCLFSKAYPPVAQHHWCACVLYRLPLLKVKKKSSSVADKEAVATTTAAAHKLTKKEVEEKLVEILNPWKEMHVASIPSNKDMKIQAQRYTQTSCTAFEFANAYDLDAAAKGLDPLKPLPVARGKAKGQMDTAVTDDEAEPVEEKKGARKRAVAAKLTQARQWFRDLDAKDKIRVTDAYVPKQELIDALAGSQGSGNVSSSSDLVEALLPLITGKLPLIKPRCADPYHVIPSDAFGQKVSADDEITRLADRFWFRFTAMRALESDQARQGCVMAEVPDWWKRSGLIVDESYDKLEYVTQLELAAVLGFRLHTQWKQAFTVFYKRVLEPLGQEDHADLDLTLPHVGKFVTLTLECLLHRAKEAIGTPTKRAREPKPKAKPKSKEKAKAETNGNGKTSKKKKKANGKANGKDEAEASGSGSDSSSSSGSGSGSDSSDSDSGSSSGEESDTEAKPSKKKARKEKDALIEEDDEGDPQVYAFRQRILEATGINLNDGEQFCYDVYVTAKPPPVKDTDKESETKEPFNRFEKDPRLFGFFQRLCKSVQIQGPIGRLGEDGDDDNPLGSYVFQLPHEPESFLIMPFNPFAKPGSALLEPPFEKDMVVLVSKKERSTLEKTLNRMLLDAPTIVKLLDGLPPLRPLPKPAATSTAVAPPVATDKPAPMDE